jgi:hypothetical protein
VHRHDRDARQRRRLDAWHDFPAACPGTWYAAALANKLSGMNLTDGIPDDGSGFGNVDIKTQFNVNLGNTGASTELRSISAWTATRDRR